MERRIAAIFAHPDDESTFAAGAAARYAAEGATVYLLLATKGEAGELGRDSSIKREDLPAVREAEAQRAATLLGLREVEYLGFHDGTMGEVPVAEVTARIEAALRRWRPQVIIAHGPTGISNHPDHVATHLGARAAFEALRGLADGPVSLYYPGMRKAAFEAQGLKVEGPETAMTTYINIEAYLEKKLAALECHRSQRDVAGTLAMFRKLRPRFETFHRAYPPLSAGQTEAGFLFERP